VATSTTSMEGGKASFRCGVENAHAVSAERVAELLGSDIDRGLSWGEAELRLRRCGSNELRIQRGRSLFRIIMEQFENLFIVLLLAAALFSLYVGEVTDAALIIVIIVFMAFVGALQEYRAERILEGLKRLASPKARVLRDGKVAIIPSENLVPGDVVLLSEGDRVPADARLVETRDLYVDESMLTGESMPVHKEAGVVVAENALVSERLNMVFSGTYVTRGSAKAIVTATGINTYIGRIARIMEQSERVRTPFQEELDRLAKRIAIIVTVIAILNLAIGLLLSEAGLLDLILASIALAVAAVPEGLPAVVTITFSIAAWNMARRNALVRRLAAVEALGSANVIATDKTGTLTMNEMTVKRVLSAAGEECVVRGEGYGGGGHVECGGARLSVKDSAWARLVALTAALNNNAELVDGRVQGDPLEASLLVFAERMGLNLMMVRRDYRRIREVGFSSERKMMTVVVESGRETLVLSKGAPEVIIERSVSYMDTRGNSHPMDGDSRDALLKLVEEEAGKGFRVIALAYRRISADEARGMADSELESGLTFLALLSLIDPPRPEVPEAVRKAIEAGIRVVMVTGDHPSTAQAVARMIGLPSGKTVTGWDIERMGKEELLEAARDAIVYARVTPEHKARIVEAYREMGYVVAVTGDGVNDAPALKLADIGVAMGVRGTEVAKEAADIVLLDDNFASIIAAIEEGRRSFDNVKRTTLYLLSANLAEVVTVLYASLRGIGIIFSAPMLLWLNVVTDAFPAIGLAFEEAEPDVMKRPPRGRREPVLGRAQFKYLTLLSIVEVLLTLGFYHLYALHDVELGRAAAFLALMDAELAQSMALRRLNESSLDLRALVKNKPWLFGYMVGALLAALAVTMLAPLFKLAPLGLVDVMGIFAVSHMVVLGYEEARKRLGLRI